MHHHKLKFLVRAFFCFRFYPDTKRSYSARNSSSNYSFQFDMKNDQKEIQHPQQFLKVPTPFINQRLYRQQARSSISFSSQSIINQKGVKKKNSFSSDVQRSQTPLYSLILDGSPNQISSINQVLTKGQIFSVSQFSNKFSKTQLKQYFQALDADGDGVIHASDLLYYLQYIGVKVKQKQAQQMIKLVNMDGKGITLNQFYTLSNPSQPKQLYTPDSFLLKKMKLLNKVNKSKTLQDFLSAKESCGKINQTLKKL